MFDGYGSGLTTKDHGHRWHATKKMSVALNIEFECSMLVTFDQEALSSHMSIKQILIKLLAEHLCNVKLQTRKSQGDADLNSAVIAVEIAG
jgi:hypothetical protein